MVPRIIVSLAPPLRPRGPVSLEQHSALEPSPICRSSGGCTLTDPLPSPQGTDKEEMKLLNHDKVIDEFETVSKDVKSVQRKTLQRILRENSTAEYLKEFGLGGLTDTQSFKERVPLCTHDDLQPYIQRIIDGDASPVLTVKPITTMSLSSGTTQGKPKFVPFNEELMKSTMQIFKTSFAFRNREYPIEKGKAMQFIYSSKQFTTKGGLNTTTATTNVYRSNEFRQTMKAIYSEPCSPPEVIFGHDFQQALYCHLLCGLLYCEEVQFISSAFAHSIVFAFRTLEQVWEELCDDIRTGVLSSRITIQSMRDAVSGLLKPNPELADSIHKKISQLDNWCGVIPEIWPNSKYLYGIMTGSMLPYLKKLRHYAGSLPLLSADYGSSEGWIGANVNPRLPPEAATFAILPNIAYFEFIPLGQTSEGAASVGTVATVEGREAQPIDLDEVKLGEEYEIVITNPAGLYRYRLGDVVKVVSYHNSTPEIQFVCRRNLLLSVNIDKNTEKDLQLAVQAASEVLAREKLEIVDFTSNVDRTVEPGHYVIFWELNGEARNDVLSNCCNCLDASFVDAGYIGSRKIHAIGALELRTVGSGTFHKIMNHFMGLGAGFSQYKTPRFVCASNSGVLQILCSNVVTSCFSTAYS